MKAIIIKANYPRSLYIFEREDGEYGFFELLDFYDLEPEEKLIGDFSEPGEKMVVHEATSKKFKIFIEDFCSLKQAEEMIR